MEIKENTNKAIAVNSLINYAKMFLTSILALLTTRFALQALGVNDFGLFSVLGSIISFIGIFNTIMVSTCNRFLAVAIGKGQTEEVNEQFNVNRNIFVCIAVVLLIISFPIGDWYIHNHINYDGPKNNAMMVYMISIVGSVLSTIGIPYHGLLIAKERFMVFSLVDVLSHFLRLLVTILLVNHFNNKLLVYTLTVASLTSIPVLVYWLYCKRVFPELIRFRIIRNKELYKQVFSFSGWVSYGAIACVARSQGAALLVNAFFNTAMNTALGLANSLNAYITMFANNLTQPIQPQITKSYTIGNVNRVNELLIMCIKYSFMLMLLISCPFFMDADWLLSLWLGNVPDYVSAFLTLLIIDNLVQSFNSGISSIIFASGKIALYQVVINTMRIIAIIVAFFVLRTGAQPQSLFYTYILFSVLAVAATQWCLKKTLNYNLKTIVLYAYAPSISVLVLFLPVLFLPDSIHSLLRITIAMLYLLCLYYLVGLNMAERKQLQTLVNLLIRKH